MDDTTGQENTSPAFNKLDLSQLSGFSFGTQWSQEKPAPQDERERGSHRGPRDDRRDRRPPRRAGDDSANQRDRFEQPRRGPQGPAGQNRPQGDRQTSNFRR